MRRTAFTLTALLAAAPLAAHAAVPIEAGGLSNLEAGDSGDAGWILAASTMVMLLVLPGLALFFGGMVRRANLLSTGLQIAASTALVSLLWLVGGYTLAFGTGLGTVIGDGSRWMLILLDNVRPGTYVPESAFVLFQMTMAMTAVALVVGACVERARFGWIVTFAALWSLVVYAPIAHAVWGGGWLALNIRTVDFGGGLVVLTSAGSAALVVALLMGRRLVTSGADRQPVTPLLTFVGALLIWVGWFGFSGGNALAATDDAAMAILNSHAAAVCGAFAWALLENFTSRKSSATGWAFGALAGLAAIAAPAGFVSIGGAMLIGLVGGALCHGARNLVARRIGVDDGGQVFAIFGVGGIFGSLAVAVMMMPAMGGVGYAPGFNLVSQLAAQAVGVGAIVVWSMVASAVLALVVSLFMPMRVHEDDERAGLDISSHGESGWAAD